MKLKQKRKRLITPLVTFAMLFSAAETTAAAGPIPAVTADMAAETEQQAEPETESEIEENSLPAPAAEGTIPTFQEAYEAMAALREKYPEGMEWTNFTPYGSNGSLGDSYVWNGGSIYGAGSGVGCAAFAFILSDAAFGSLPARPIANGSFKFEDVKVGDILRVNGNSHSVIVLQKSAAGVIIAEANYNKSVHWGRVMSEAEVLAADYIITRYPEGYVSPDDPDAGTVEHGGTVANLNWSLTKAGVLTISGTGEIPDCSPNDNNVPEWNNYSVSTIIIEKGVTGIGDYAFYQNKALSIYLPDGITKIGQSAFYGSSLMSATIPGTVETIGNDAFRSCANLTSVTVSEGTKSIGERAFRSCTSLTHIDFPASITSVGSGAFADCNEMTRVRFMPGTGTATLGDNLFSACRKLTSVTLPQTADSISTGMFASCNLLPELYIPASVKEIGENPFTSCGSLKYIYFGGSEAEWNAMMSPQLNASLNSTGTTVIFDAAFDNPFAPDPDDPGNPPTDDDETGKDPTKPGDDEDNTEPGDGEDTTAPGDNEDNTGPDEDEGKTDDIPTAGSPDGSNDNSGSLSASDSTGRPVGTGNRGGQYEYIRRPDDEPLNSSNLPAYSEVFPDSESKPADSEKPEPQDTDEIESAPDELSANDTEENGETAGKEAEPENNGRSDKSGIGIMVSVLTVSVAAASAAAFVFLRKKNIFRNKSE